MILFQHRTAEGLNTQVIKEHIPIGGLVTHPNIQISAVFELDGGGQGVEHGGAAGGFRRPVRGG